eukprot:1582775-Rhodomonas_salina.2
MPEDSAPPASAAQVKRVNKHCDDDEVDVDVDDDESSSSNNNSCGKGSTGVCRASRGGAHPSRARHVGCFAQPWP